MSNNRMLFIVIGLVAIAIATLILIVRSAIFVFKTKEPIIFHTKLKEDK